MREDKTNQQRGHVLRPLDEIGRVPRDYERSLGVHPWAGSLHGNISSRCPFHQSYELHDDHAPTGTNGGSIDIVRGLLWMRLKGSGLSFRCASKPEEEEDHEFQLDNVPIVGKRYAPKSSKKKGGTNAGRG